MLKLMRIFKKLIIIVAVVIAIYSAIYDIRKVEAASIDSALNGNDGWDIKQEKDKLTDETVIKAYKQYPIDDGRVEVVVNCTSENRPLVGILEYVDFDFTIFSNSKLSSKKFNSSFNGKNTVPFEYRLDAGKVKKWESDSEYNNFAEVAFTKKEHLDKLADFFPALNYLTPPILEDLLKSETLRVRLPVYGESPVDISIQLSYLKNFFDNCSVSKSVSNNKSDKDNANKESSVALKTIEKTERNENKLQTIVNSNCTNSNKSSLDVLICSDDDLLALNRQLNSDYHKHMQDINEYTKSSFKAEQIKWNKSRSHVCNLQTMGQIDENESKVIIACLKDMYKQRLAELEAR